MFSTIRDQSV